MTNYKLDEDYWLFTPHSMEGPIPLFRNGRDLKLYENINDNTKAFLQKTLTNLKNGREETIKLVLYYCGDPDELPISWYSSNSTIKEFKDNIIARYYFVTGKKTDEFFIGFLHSETHYTYDYIYLDFGELIEEFEKYGIQYSVNPKKDDALTSAYRDDSSTKFEVIYNPTKVVGNEEKKPLNKVRLPFTGRF